MEFKKFKEMAMEEYAKGSEGMAEKDLAWMRQQIIEANPQWTTFGDKDRTEYYILRQLIDFIYKIKNDNVKDIRTFVETELRRKGYKELIETIRGEIRTVAPKENKKLDGLVEKTTRVMETVAREDPEYLPTIKKFATLASVEITKKRKGEDPGKTHVQVRR